MANHGVTGSGTRELLLTICGALPGRSNADHRWRGGRCGVGVLRCPLEDPDAQARAFIYTEDATFAMPGILIEGRRAMLERLKSGTVLESVTLTPDAIERRGDLAYAYGSFSCIDRGRPVAMRFPMVLRKESDGNWRVQREFLVDEVPSNPVD